MTSTPALSAPTAAHQVAALLPESPLGPWHVTAFRTGYTDAPAAQITDGSRAVIAAFHKGHTTLAWERRGESATYPLIAVPGARPSDTAREILRSALPDLDTAQAPATDPARAARDFLDELGGAFAARRIATTCWTTQLMNTTVRTWQRGPALLLLESSMAQPTLNLEYGGREEGFYGGALADFESLFPAFLPTRPRHSHRVLGNEITGGIPRRLYSRFSYAPMRQYAPYDCLSFGRNVGPTGQIETPDYRARARDNSPVHAYVDGLGLDFVRSILDRLTDPAA
ncbi:hypothetical protein [Streptomyces sp. MZ04]|uniref:hypothetical protein n=1 Tax=Streptomyces sp. MZ04 TaxID=2559236 RepID=UPI00107ED5AB|nr:hypothetical protein [Streptomyces sp. MZ04]TGB03219.1 hypothetical protein E2651_25660 [Streptomyces sp. MZ04]